jgi:hypothetical protein
MSGNPSEEVVLGKPPAIMIYKGSEIILTMPWLKYETAKMFHIFNMIKEKIPASDRKFIQESNLWYISNRHQKILKAIIQDHYDLQEIQT